MNDDLKRVNLRDIVDRISENTIVLPDFQRGFTWKENNRQKALLASVLTKLPIGTVLFLNVKTEDYGYKKIGKNERNIDNLEGKQEVKALLDGQQRITVLTAFLSTKLQRENIDDLVSPTLERRYFLNLPSFQGVIDSKKEDLFGGTILSFPNSFRGNYPEISSEEMKERITFVHDRKKAFLYEKAETKDTREIREYCRNIDNSEDGDAYLLPLFYLLDACEPGSSGAVILEDVVKEIGAEYEKSIRSWLQAEEYPIEEKEQYLEKFGLEDVQREAVLEEIKTGTLFLPKEEREDNFSDRLKERKMQWGMHLCEYLRKCIEDIRLYEIAISVNDKKRAIDIYENLNLGGKSLSVFDLILAKASRHTQEKGNLFTQIVDDIERDHREEYTSFVEKCSTGQKNSYKNHIADSDKPYSAVGRIGCWDKSQKELSATYIKALMNLLGIIDYFSEGDPGFSLRDAEKIQNLNVKVTKREYLLQIPSEKIYGYVEVACQGLDRAALFLQMRCGIRKLGEIHYNLMWVILGTVFLDEAWFEDSEVLDYMEVWYWSAILSGEFKIEQNRAFIRNLQNVLSEIQNIKESDKKFTKALCNNVLTDKKFADRDIVLMKNPSVYPEEVIGNTICQFYLSETYSDILKPLPEKNDYQPQTLSALNNSVKLQKHHIMPIGSLSVKYKDANKTTESRRKDNSSEYFALMEQRNYLPPADVGSIIGDFERTANRWYRKGDELLEEIDDYAKEVDENVREYHDSCNRYEKLQKQLDEHIDFAEKRKTQRFYKSEIQRFSKEKGEKEGRIEACKKRIETTEKEMQSLEARNERNRIWRQRLEIAEELYRQLYKEFSEQENKIFLELNRQIQENFSKMFNAKDKKIELTPKYEIQMLYRTQQGYREEKNLSEGEKIARNFAFIVTIMDFSRRKKQEKTGHETADSDTLPIVLDGPFSKLGDENIELIAKVLPQVSEQVIIFMLKKDWEYTKLDPYVGSRYYIDKKPEESFATIKPAGEETV